MDNNEHLFTSKQIRWLNDEVILPTIFKASKKCKYKLQKHDIDDITQGSWIRILKYWHKKPETTKNEVWISRQANFQALDYIRKAIKENNRTVALYENTCTETMHPNDYMMTISMVCPNTTYDVASMIEEGYHISEISTQLGIDSDQIEDIHLKKIKKITKK